MIVSRSQVGRLGHAFFEVARTASRQRQTPWGALKQEKTQMILECLDHPGNRGHCHSQHTSRTREAFLGGRRGQVLQSPDLVQGSNAQTHDGEHEHFVEAWRMAASIAQHRCAA
jgi:hypothetical protein